MKLFNELVRIPGRVLLLEDPAPEIDQSKAKAMLRDLGTNPFFRAVERSEIALGLASQGSVTRCTLLSWHKSFCRVLSVAKLHWVLRASGA